MTIRKHFHDSVKKPQLIELLTDIVAASSAVNPRAVQDAVGRAHDVLVNAGLWNDESIPVVDGKKDAEVYGYATSPLYAKVIASECHDNLVDHIEYGGPITLRDGTKISHAYVVVAKPVTETTAHAA